MDPGSSLKNPRTSAKRRAIARGVILLRSPCPTKPTASSKASLLTACPWCWKNLSLDLSAERKDSIIKMSRDRRVRLASTPIFNKSKLVPARVPGTLSKANNAASLTCRSALEPALSCIHSDNNSRALNKVGAMVGLSPKRTTPLTFPSISGAVIKVFKPPTNWASACRVETFLKEANNLMNWSFVTGRFKLGMGTRNFIKPSTIPIFPALLRLPLTPSFPSSLVANRAGLNPTPLTKSLRRNPPCPSSVKRITTGFPVLSYI